jgi:hypothetical protein
MMNLQFPEVDLGDKDRFEGEGLMIWWEPRISKVNGFFLFSHANSLSCSIMVLFTGCK